MEWNGETFYLTGDHLGSIVLVTDANGSPVAEERYFPFGEPRLGVGKMVTDKGFTGQRAEAAFGLLDYHARYYDPILTGSCRLTVSYHLHTIP